MSTDLRITVEHAADIRLGSKAHLPGLALHISIFAVLLGLLGCVPVPQTRQEYVLAISRRQRPDELRSFRLQRPLAAVMKHARPRVMSCLSVREVYTHVPRSGPEQVFYRPTFERLGAGRAEMTLRSSGGINAPEGGAYVLAVDLEEVAGQTHVQMYIPPWGFDDAAQAVEDWLRGGDADCPELGTF